MRLFAQYCPTFTRIILWLWDSPTFTKWGSQGVNATRFLLVTPLLLTRFNETEIAAWYLFGSLSFFGTIMQQRLGVTFSRMFAFAMGGASNLAPIKGKQLEENDGKPNWTAFERAYGTISWINLGIAGANVGIAFLMGWFALDNILAGYPEKGSIWLAFLILQGTGFVGNVFQRYGIALNGMNYVAMDSRWNMIFSMLAILAASLTLFFGGGIIALVVAMQVFSLLGILRSRLLLASVEEGRVLRIKQYSFDREVLTWAWPPTWKGFVSQLGLLGSIRLTAVFYTSFATKSEAASLLFALSNMQTIIKTTQTPIGAVMPLMSRLLAKGELNTLAKLVRRRSAISFSLMAVVILGFGLAIPPILELIGANIDYISTKAWLLFGGLVLLQRYLAFSGAISAIGNEFVFYWHWCAGAIVGAACLLLLKDAYGVYTPILTAVVPSILIVNIKPLRIAAEVLQERRLAKRVADFAFICIAYGVIAVAMSSLA